MVYTFEEIKQKVTPIADEYGLFSLILFGSYARGEAAEESDLVYDGKLTGLMQYSSLVRKLESIFGCHVDLVSTNNNNKKFLKSILEEGVLIYEKKS